MSPFQYTTASTPDEAMSLIGKNGRYLGGGIDLLGEMKEYIVEPDVLVDVKNIAKGSAQPAGGEDGQKGPTDSFVLDGNMTVAEIAAHPELAKHFPGLAQAASEIGSPQIRNVATLAGNLLQHSRCWYYRQPDITCLKRGGKVCYGREGENKYLSLFSGCDCVSPIVSNLSVMLDALGAEVQLDNAQTPPTISIAELYKPAWDNPNAHNSLKRWDLLGRVIIPTLRSNSAYRQVSEKNEFDWALVSCAAAGKLVNGKLFYARVVLGAVAPVPYMVAAANDYLEGKDLTDETASHAADLILKNAKPLEHNGYKIPLAHTLIRRTLLALNA